MIVRSAWRVVRSIEQATEGAERDHAKHFREVLESRIRDVCIEIMVRHFTLGVWSKEYLFKLPWFLLCRACWTRF